MLAKKKWEKEGLPNLAEILALMSFYQQVDTNVRTLDLLKYGGFEIKGLQGSLQASTASLGHRLAYNKTLVVGICLCGWKGEEGWSYEMTKIQHDMHTRRAKNVQTPS